MQFKTSTNTTTDFPFWKKMKIANDDLNKIIGSRSSSQISVINKKLYLFGGENIPRIPSNSNLYMIDFSVKQPIYHWQEIKTFGKKPPKRLGHSQIAINNFIYIFGGRQGISMNELPLNDLWKFDVLNSKWIEINQYDNIAPSKRSFHTMTAIKNFIYIYGGCGQNGRLSDLHCFDIIHNRWIPNINNNHFISGRGGSCIIPSNDECNLFIIGGFKGKESNAIYKYSISENNWYTVYKEDNDQIMPFSVFICGKINNKIVCFGGEISPSIIGHNGAGKFSNDLYIFDGNDATIKKNKINYVFPERPLPRGWSSGCNFTKDEIIIFGGLTGNDEFPKKLNDIWILELQK